MAGVLEKNRQRVAIALTLCGGGLILGGIILILYHQYNIKTIGNLYAEGAKARNLPLAQAIRYVLFWLLIIVGIFSIGTLAMIRWSRRFRRRLLRKSPPPTEAEDVWTMHRLPTEGNEDVSPATPGPSIPDG